MKLPKPTINRLATGVPGLDDILGGGLPEFSFNLIAGAPGSGKTTLAHQLMFAMATTQKPAVYFTVLGEPPLKMLRSQQQFDFFDLDKLSHCVRLQNLGEDAISGNLDRVLAKITKEVETHKPALVCVDSFRSVVLANQGEGGAFNAMQQFIQKLGVLLASWETTTFLIGEYIRETDPNPIFTIADGLIWLRQSEQHNSVVRKIEIAKMRGQPTRPGRHTFRISGAGIKISASPEPSLPIYATRYLPSQASQT